MDLTITRVFDAPVKKVWDVWTSPDHVKKWWGPEGFSCPHATIDFRVGGKYLYCMRGAPGPGMPEQDFWSGGVYKEIVPMKKIVMTDHFMDAKGNIISPKDVGMPGDWTEEMVVTVTFEEAGKNKTKMTLHHTGHPVEMVSMAEAGWGTSLDKFAAALR
jgi:uncharacterized protein YndB with AHSA1/START domain